MIESTTASLRAEGYRNIGDAIDQDEDIHLKIPQINIALEQIKD